MLRMPLSHGRQSESYAVYSGDGEYIQLIFPTDVKKPSRRGL